MAGSLLLIIRFFDGITLSIFHPSFYNSDGKPVSFEHSTQRKFKKSQIDAGLDKIIRFHDLRHTFAINFMMNGGNIYTL